MGDSLTFGQMNLQMLNIGIGHLRTYFIYLVVFIAFGGASSNLLAQDKPAYVIYRANGKKVSYRKMLKKISGSDVVLFGEFHDNPICHWLQYEMAVDLLQTKALLLGAEMIEADKQEILDQYLIGTIDDDGFQSGAGLWVNYETDYAPLVELARDSMIPFFATNVPRRYATMVFQGDFAALDTLSDLERRWIAPLPILFDSELKTYREILDMMDDHGSPLLVKAQALKDATMAHFILKNWLPGHIFLHFNGTYHSDEYEGILWYLRQENSTLKYATISTVLQEDNRELLPENKGKADFILCVDQDMTVTH